MDVKHIGIEEARTKLGLLVNAVRTNGATVVLTRNGRPIARIVPYITGEQVLSAMYGQLLGRAGHEPFDLQRRTYTAAALLLGENENDMRVETQARVLETAELGIRTMCAAVGIADPDDVDEQPAAVGATNADAMKVIAGIIDVTGYTTRTPMVINDRQAAQLVDVHGGED